MISFTYPSTLRQVPSYFGTYFPISGRPVVLILRISLLLQNKCNVGYAFINMTDPALIVNFYQVY